MVIFRGVGVVCLFLFLVTLIIFLLNLNFFVLLFFTQKTIEIKLNLVHRCVLVTVTRSEVNIDVVESDSSRRCYEVKT